MMPLNRIPLNFLAFVLILLPFGQNHAQPPRQPMPTENDRGFMFDLLQFECDPPMKDSVRMDVYVAVPYSSISFVYAVDKYVADYGVVLQVSDLAQMEYGQGKLVLDKYQTYSVVQSAGKRSTLESASVEHADASQYSLTLRANHDYSVRIAVRDVSNQREHDTTIHVHTRSFGDPTLVMSDMMIYRSRAGTHIFPNIGQDVSALQGDDAGVFAELYNAPAKTTYGVLTRLSILGGKRDSATPNELGRWSSPLVTNGSPQIPVFQNVSIPDLWLGRYSIELYLFANAADTAIQNPDSLKAHAALSTSREVYERAQRGIPFNGGDVDEAIDQVSIIATSSEMDSLHAGKTTDDKRRALTLFWRRRNPDPSSKVNEPMEVFFRRIDYANQTYSDMARGWRSDRGRTYIALGAPTNTDRHPYEVNQKPYEIWYYNDLNTRYIFVDEYMLGDYRFASAPPPSGIFLWQRQSY